ncbi:MAG: glutaredoxin family protein [Methylophilaceae bacterium]
MKKIILLLGGVFFFQYFSQAETVEISKIKHDNVILYATSWCGYCKKTRAFLAENDIEYIEYNIEESEKGRKQHKALGGNGVPTLDIKGTVIHGYSIKNMKYALKELNLM